MENQIVLETENVKVTVEFNNGISEKDSSLIVKIVRSIMSDDELKQFVNSINEKLNDQTK